MNDFIADNAWQEGIRNEFLVPWYKRKFASFHKIPIDRVAQKNGDTVVRTHTGKTIMIEEKMARWKGRRYDAIVLETDSCMLPNRETPGWMKTSNAMWLLWRYYIGPEDQLECWWIDLQPLKQWFWEVYQRYPVDQREERNRSRNRRVPYTDIIAAGIACKSIVITRPRNERCGCGKHAPFGHKNDLYTCGDHRDDPDMLSRLRADKEARQAAAWDVDVQQLRSQGRGWDTQAVGTSSA